MLAEALVCGPPNLLATQHSQISRWHYLKLESHLHFSWGYLGGLLALQLMIGSQLYLCLPTSSSSRKATSRVPLPGAVCTLWGKGSSPACCLEL